MPEFWQFPTGSMGLGPINAIYAARFMRYLEHQSLLDTGGRKVWSFVGDGEMDEPESARRPVARGAPKASTTSFSSSTATCSASTDRCAGTARSCRSSSLFAGAGWNVVKLLWGSDWDPLFARDTDGVLLKRLHETVDGEFQTYAATDGRFNRSASSTSTRSSRSSSPA